MKPIMVIDYNKCTGCLSCVEACIAENINRIGLDGENIYPDDVVAYSRTRPVNIEYQLTIRKVFKQCVQCDEPPCVYSCPTGASYKDENGIVLLDDSICIRCGLCIMACPYDARTLLEEGFGGVIKHREALKDRIPDKCTFCIHRRNGEGLWTPACVEACPHEARLFGDLDNPMDEAARLVLSGVAVMPRGDLGTRPKLYIVPRRGAFEVTFYPARREDQLVSYNVWSSLRDTVIRPIFQIGGLIAIIFGLIHMVRGRRHGEE